MKTITYSFSKYLTLRLNLTIYLAGFTIPFIFSSSQLVTGTIVNTLIFTASDKLDKKAVYPILILPSLGALTHGILFGPQTFFLAYFLPFIWLGNYLQSTIFIFTKQQKYLVRITISSIAKYILLFASAHIYFKFHIVPQIFITSMGLIQLATAALGGLLSYFVLQILKQYVRS